MTTHTVRLSRGQSAMRQPCLGTGLRRCDVAWVVIGLQPTDVIPAQAGIQTRLNPGNVPESQTPAIQRRRH